MRKLSLINTMCYCFFLHNPYSHNGLCQLKFNSISSNLCLLIGELPGRMLIFAILQTKTLFEKGISVCFVHCVSPESRKAPSPKQLLKRYRNDPLHLLSYFTVMALVYYKSQQTVTSGPNPACCLIFK